MLTKNGSCFCTSDSRDTVISPRHAGWKMRPKVTNKRSILPIIKIAKIWENTKKQFFATKQKCHRTLLWVSEAETVIISPAIFQNMVIILFCYFWEIASPNISKYNVRNLELGIFRVTDICSCACRHAVLHKVEIWYYHTTKYTFGLLKPNRSGLCLHSGRLPACS